MGRARVRWAVVAVAASALAGGCATVLGIHDLDGGPGGDASLPDAAEGGGPDGGDTGTTDAGGDGSDASDADAGPASCREPGNGRSDCGESKNQNCCSTWLVDGGDFLRSYDGVDGGGFTDASWPAHVSGFRLDTFEVTVGRFRKFVEAVSPNDGGAGWQPAAFSGKHSHLNGGNGLRRIDPDGGPPYEAGWLSQWNSMLASQRAAWDSALKCDVFPTWTPGAASNENLPLVCATWWEAYAFCIWDGAFLPSEAEWNYAAAGGTEQRAYPYSKTPLLDCQAANYANCTDAGTIAVGLTPKGEALWHQQDMTGNAWEWALDSWETDYGLPCNDCVGLISSQEAVMRGGSFRDYPPYLLASYRGHVARDSRNSGIGFRCARSP